jgi:endonuclease/exonuclease/phosphatase family metal-dependent hydrolase
MRIEVRCWNVFHGRTFPETRRPELERMIRLVTAGGPDLVCLQEVPVWAIERLEVWSGMKARAAVTVRSLLGPLAGRLQRLDARRVRSPLTGQANAVLVTPRLGIREAANTVLNTRGERRVAQVVRLCGDPGELVLVNTHLTTRDPPAATAELARIAVIVADEPSCLVCGDLNLRQAGLAGFSQPIEGIDQILVRGLSIVAGPRAWPDERRRLGTRLLSDHAPLEAEMMWA